MKPPFRVSPPGHLEKQVKEFGETMLHQLRGHEFIGNWDDWRPTPEELELIIARTWLKLRQAKAEANFDKVRELAADLGNCALKASRLYGKK